MTHQFNRNGWEQTENQIHTGVDIAAAISQSSGVVLYVGYTTAEKYSVIVQYNAKISFRYSMILRPLVSVRDVVAANQKLGTTEKFCHMEYLTDEPNEYPVYVAGITLYKHDPSEAPGVYPEAEEHLIFDMTREDEDAD